MSPVTLRTAFCTGGTGSTPKEAKRGLQRMCPFLFTILSGVGFGNEIALMAYSLILAINRPIEMLVTALNVTGDTACAMVVSKSENALDKVRYEA